MPLANIHVAEGRYDEDPDCQRCLSAIPAALMKPSRK